MVLRIIVCNNEMVQLSQKGNKFNSDCIFMIFTYLLKFKVLKFLNL
jgi:hypothetical protein